jgi:Glycosyl transferases group 1
MALGLTITPFTSQRLLLAHSNSGPTTLAWHERRRLTASSLGYDLSVFSTADYHPYTIFPYLDKLWRRRDPKLMRMYDALGKAIDACDVFIHYNGALIHPEFLRQFDKLTIYHCADDPDASSVLSRPVAPHYDMCAISNPACIEMYREWGCRNTFFWPLGSFSYIDGSGDSLVRWSERNVPLVFIGSKRGVTNVRYIGKYLGLYRKTRFMRRIERTFPDLIAHGSGWKQGRADDSRIAALYTHARIGFNVHNSLGPINGRLYDLAAFGVCQICDNKSTLNLVFEEGKEIVGFDSVDECIDLMRYYLAHPEEAEQIGAAGRERFLRDYSTAGIWTTFVANVNRVSGGSDMTR